MVKSTTVKVLALVTLISFLGLIALHQSLNFTAFSNAGKFIRKAVLADEDVPIDKPYGVTELPQNTNDIVDFRQDDDDSDDEIRETKYGKEDDTEEDEEEEEEEDEEEEGEEEEEEEEEEETEPVRRPRLPKALIIGFSKCGTTALRTFLTLHPQIVSPIEEVRYFNFNYTKGLEWYRRQMPPSTPNQITIEKTPSYIMSPIVLKRIYLYDSQVKLIIIVRDPIIRLQSQYAHTFRNAPPGAQKPAFKFWVKGDTTDRRITHFIGYTKYIGEVYDQFPRDQVLVLAEEDFEQNPLSVMKEVESFLNIKPAFSKDMFYYNKSKGFYCFNRENEFFPTVLKMVKVNNRTGCLGEDKGRDHPDIDDDFMEELVKFIRPHNEQLFKLIGKKIIWENFE
ncbi:heparan sulfate glucosamine 3-O-sulfotransferase 5-like [Elysia marginata]|uniref:Heparan sulfate glucosamine 3-O-sulfotransferase 5-like n=1 Tax=Elysia marginata TaxID=1093978 RepID=A0AAV4I138_9GAST|nr:heparan sulfate glucosamine 3-O-sulfotransferase 5-like [Elysia marginata]